MTVDQWPAIGPAGAIGHGIAATAFSLLAVILATLWARGRRNGWLMIASVATAVWAGVGAIQPVGSGWWEPVFQWLDIVRGAAWAACPFTLLAGIWDRNQRRRATTAIAAAIGVICAAALIYEAYSLLAAWNLAAAATVAWAGFGFVGRLLIAVVGLLLIENLYRNTRSGERWTIKPLCIGLGGLFAYDFFLYSDALLFRHPAPDLLDARGFVAAAIAPFIVIFLRHDPDPAARPAISRQTVFHGTTFVAAGAYLLLMWAVALYLRQYGGQWGSVLQILFFFAALLVLAAVLFSGGFRARLKILIAKHLFHYRYDYREEWLRFIETMSSETAGYRLEERAVRGIADIVESPKGVLWLAQEDGMFEAAGAWRARPREQSHTADPGLIAFFEKRGWVVDLHEYGASPEVYAGLEIPGWLSATETPWLVIPLLHHNRLLGLVELHRARAPRRLDWEDYDLLKTVGRQAAHYLAEQRTARKLLESRQFDAFNRRFTFVLHDIKNLISQLSLLLSNVKKHRDDPAFQNDMFETIQESVTKMNHLLARLHQDGKEETATPAIDLASFLTRVARWCSREPGDIELDCREDGLTVLADDQRLSAVMTHLIANALDAVAKDGRVRVRLRRVGRSAEITVEDDGVGMDVDFVRHELFRPFRTSKHGGYGIGAYESREYVRELGGTIAVESNPERGTTVRITLPTVEATPSDRAGRVTAARP